MPREMGPLFGPGQEIPKSFKMPSEARAAARFVNPPYAIMFNRRAVSETLRPHNS
jgi:hypothetical protein